MKIKYLLVLVSFLLLMLHSGCKDSPTEICDDTDTSRVEVYKPNIYIYPNKSIDLSVNIAFPLGGKITESIPDYNSGWNVSVSPGGIINNEYQFLFYECDVPDLFQKEKGWIIIKTELKSFFENNLNAHGFSSNEIKDFTDYWIPKLIASNNYEIYPQYLDDIEKIIVLNFSKEPRNIFRLFYYLKGRNDKNFEMEEPIIEKGKREDYYVMEWGVILK
jgi:hypothetical protein